MGHRAAAIAQAHRLQAFVQGSGPHPLIPVRIGAALRRWHRDGCVQLAIAAPAVAQSQQIGVTAFGNAVVGAESTGSVVNAPDDGHVGGDRRLQLDAQIVEQLAVVLPERFFVEADLGVVADAFQHTEAQPGLKPQPGANSHDALPERLGGKIGVGSALVVFTATLLLGDVAEQIRFQLHSQRSGAPDASLKADAQHGLRSHVTFEQKGVAEGGIDHLTAPGGDRPGLGMPVGHRRQQGGAGQFRWLRRCRGEGLRLG